MIWYLDNTKKGEKIMSLQVKNIKKAFDKKVVLDDASFEFEKGKIYGVLGRNGAGKTTLFNCISKNIEIDEGSIELIEGEESVELNYKNVGFVYTIPVLPVFLTGYEFIKFFIDINEEYIDDKKTVDEYLDIVDIKKEDRHKLIKGYSHGMQNKLQLLCTIIIKPAVILLDEPLTSFDVVVAHEIKQLLLELKNEHIVLMSTHIVQLAKDMCDELVILQNGKLAGMKNDTASLEEFEDKLIEMLKEEQDNGEIKEDI